MVADPALRLSSVLPASYEKSTPCRLGDDTGQSHAAAPVHFAAGARVCNRSCSNENLVDPRDTPSRSTE